MNKLRDFRLNTLFKPAVVVFAAGTFLILVNLLTIHHSRPYNSDDVSWQNILLTWWPFNGHQIILGGADSFAAKVPFFVLFGHFFGVGRKVLLLESAFFAVLSFSFFYYAALYFLRKLKVKITYLTLLPVLWFASFGYSIGQMSLNPILRNFELGLSFVFFVIAAKLYYGEINPRRRLLNIFLAVIFSLIAGILIFNDPYFLYFTLLPIAGLYAFLFWAGKVSRVRTSVLAICLLGSLAVSKLAEILLAKAGLHLAFKQPVQFVTFDNLFSNIALALHSLLVIFGADFFGQNLYSLQAIVALINFVILVFLGALTLRTFLDLRTFKSARDKLDDSRLWSAFLVCLSALVLAVYTISNVAVDIYSYRYLIILLYASILFLTISARSTVYGRWLNAFLIMAIASNFALFFSHTPSAEPGSYNNVANSENKFLIDTITSTGIQKGYTTYWDGNINSYLSKGKIEFLPIICVNHTTIENDFLVDTTLFRIPAKTSFYIVDPNLNFPPACSVSDIIRQFGKPDRTLYVGQKQVLLYPYDIRTRMN